MNDLLLLVKVLSALYQAKKIKDNNLISELVDTLNELPTPNVDIYQQDKEVRDGIKASINWLLEQRDDEPIIKSMLLQRVNLFCKNDPALKDAITLGMEDIPSEEAARRAIYKHLTEIRVESEGEVFSKKFKKSIKDFYFKDVGDLTKADWSNLLDIVQERINTSAEERQTEIVASVNTEDPNSFEDIINLAKKENSKEGILRTGLQGLNQALEPDGGLRRSKFYLINALTNRGKSLSVSHLIFGVGMYNKPQLRNKAKIPTILLESGEDGLDMIIMRMYKLAITITKNEVSDFANTENQDIVSTIANCFKENGWFLIINHVDPGRDNAQTMFARVRALEVKGHEIIAWAYDYCGLQDYESMHGDSKSDKLQMHFRKIRSFIVARGICFMTPHQLSPAAKQRLQESDEESEIYFAKEVAGKSLTETSTKITNEVDVEITFHVAKTSFKNYFTGCIGKQRGEGCEPQKRFFIYDLDPDKGLVHDVLGKPKFRRSLTQSININGDLATDFDAL